MTFLRIDEEFSSDDEVLDPQYITAGAPTTGSTSTETLPALSALPVLASLKQKSTAFDQKTEDDEKSIFDIQIGDQDQDQEQKQSDDMRKKKSDDMKEKRHSEHCLLLEQGLRSKIELFRRNSVFKTVYDQACAEMKCQYEIKCKIKERIITLKSM